MCHHVCQNRKIKYSGKPFSHMQFIPQKPICPEHFLKKIKVLIMHNCGCLSNDWLTHPSSTSIDPKRLFIFLEIWIENQTPISVSRTLVPFRSQEPSLKLTVIGVIGDSTDWQSRIHRPAPLIPRSTYSQLIPEVGIQGTYAKPALVIHVLWRQRKRQDFWSSASRKHYLLSLLLCTSLPFPSWTDR